MSEAKVLGKIVPNSVPSKGRDVFGRSDMAIVEVNRSPKENGLTMPVNTLAFLFESGVARLFVKNGTAANAWDEIALGQELSEKQSWYDENAPSTVYVDKDSGDDFYGDGTSANPYQSWERAVNSLSVSNRNAEIILRSSATPYDFSTINFSGLGYVRFTGEVTEGSTTYTVDSTTSNSKSAGNVVTIGTPNETYTQDQLAGTRVLFKSGANAGRSGWIYSNAATTGSAGSETTQVRINVSDLSFRSISASETLVFMQWGTEVNLPGNMQIANSSLVFFKDLKFNSTSKNLSIWDSHRIDFERCLFDEIRTMLIGSYGRCQFAYSYLNLVGVGFLDRGAMSVSGTVITQGSVIDMRKGTNNARMHISVKPGGVFENYGENILLNLKDNGFRMTGPGFHIGPSDGTDAASLDAFFRFALDGSGTATCTNGFRVNQGAGAFGSAELEAYGEVDSAYLVQAGSGAKVLLRSGTSVITDADNLRTTNKVSADDGATESAQVSSTDTFIAGGDPSAV